MVAATRIATIAAMAEDLRTDSTLDQTSGFDQRNSPSPNVEATGGAGALALVPTGLVVLLLVLATTYDGAFHMRHWAPTALLAIVTLLALHVAGGTIVADPWLRGAAFAIWAFAAWTLLSSLWAESPSLAWQGAARTLLYAALATLALLTIAPRHRLALVGYAAVAGISLLALVTLIRMRSNG